MLSFSCKKTTEMKPPLRILLSLPLLLLPFAAAQAQLAKLVDPFLGASGGGNVFPGPVVPFGEIKPGPDMAAPAAHDPNAGWNANDDIRGFSQTHVSGTGGGAKYGNILVIPTTGASRRSTPLRPAPMNMLPLASTRSRSPATTSASTVRLRAAAPSTAFITLRERPPISSSTSATTSSPAPSRAKINCSRGLRFRILSPTEIAGSTSVTGGWNKQPNSYTVYFYARLSTPAASWGTWLNDQLTPGSKSAHAEAGSTSGAWLTFAARGSASAPQDRHLLRQHRAGPAESRR